MHEGLANHSGSMGTENYVLKAQRSGEIMRAPNAMYCQQLKRTILCVCAFVHMCGFGGRGGRGVFTACLQYIGLYILPMVITEVQVKVSHWLIYPEHTLPKRKTTTAHHVGLSG